MHLKYINYFGAVPTLLALGFTLFSVTYSPTALGDGEKDAERSAATNLPATEEEAKSRARWMHEIIHGSLQVIHRDFFGDGDDGRGGRKTLPSQSLEDVFKGMEEIWNVEIRWLGVDESVKDIDHEPQDEFEEDAAFALEDGAIEYGKMEKNRYRYVGAIVLKNECLKCHVPNRTSLEDRVAGLAIYMPLKTKENPKKP